jgi:hypothetical protein
LILKTFRSVGRIDIYNGGSNYKIGDEILFGPDPSGTDAAAAVKTVDGSGSRFLQLKFNHHELMVLQMF